MTFQEWSLAWLKGAVSSSIRGGSIGKSTPEQVGGIKRRVELNGVSEDRTREAIAAAIEESPRCNSQEAEETRRQYLK